ncbi:MAG: cupredoxin domain-containing protein [Thermomicrobiales bacterium]
MVVFQTPSVEIPAGTTVTWVNRDAVAHTVTHRPETGDADALFDSGYVQPGEFWSYTFGGEGTFDYYCIPHANMIGKVIVVVP